MKYLIGATHESGLVRGLPASLLRPGDAIVVQAGGRSLKTIREALNEVTVRFAGTGVLTFLACGPKRVHELSEMGVRILIDWEQSSYANYTALPWTWDETDTKRRINLCAHPANGNVGLLITGAPLVNRKLRRDGVSWDFGSFAYRYPPCVVQTQGFLARSTLRTLMDKLRGNNDWEQALARLALQFPYGMSKDLAVEVAMGSTPNAVTPQLAHKALLQAEKVGIAQGYLFGSDLVSVRRFLELARGAIR